MLEVRTDFCHISEVPRRNVETAESSSLAHTEQLSAILSCPHQTPSLLKWAKTLPSRVVCESQFDQKEAHFYKFNKQPTKKEM